MARQVKYSYNLDFDVRYRHFHETEDGEITWYIVQIEVIHKGRWQLIRRFDCAHGRSHINDFNYKGERRRTWLDISYENALTQAEDDIKRNWELYLDQFFQGRFPSHE